MLWINRTLCDVLEEMRALHKTRNYASLLALVEEAQSMGNRMEAKLNDIKDMEEIQSKLKELRKQYREEKEMPSLPIAVRK